MRACLFDMPSFVIIGIILFLGWFYKLALSDCGSIFVDNLFVSERV